jgi:hypothetical protein
MLQPQMQMTNLPGDSPDASPGPDRFRLRVTAPCRVEPGSCRNFATKFKAIHHEDFETHRLVGEDATTVTRKVLTVKPLNADDFFGALSRANNLSR